MENTIQLIDISSTIFVSDDVFDPIPCIICGKKSIGIMASSTYCQCTNPYTYNIPQISHSPNKSIPCKTFLNTYSVTEQQVLNGNPVIFDANNSVYGGCNHLPKSTDIWIWNSGYYQINTCIYHLEACQFSLVKNGVIIIPGSTIGSLYGVTQNSSMLIVLITESDIITPTILSPIGIACKIQLVNNTPSIPFITLHGSPSSGYSIPQITATISIVLIESM